MGIQIHFFTVSSSRNQSNLSRETLPLGTLKTRPDKALENVQRGTILPWLGDGVDDLIESQKSEMGKTNEPFIIEILCQFSIFEQKVKQLWISSFQKLLTLWRPCTIKPFFPLFGFGF